MEKNGTDVKLTTDEAKTICHMGEGSKCCAFLAFAGSGFICIKMTNMGNTIYQKLAAGTSRAKSEGGGKDCAWEGVK